MFVDLHQFLAELDRRGLLRRVQEEVSPELEICAVTDRACKSPGGGPALLFERPTGYNIPVATNVFGSEERMCLALGVRSLDDLGHQIEPLLTPPVPAGLLEAVKLLPLVARLRDFVPKTVRSAACQEIVARDGTLDDLPILRCWPEDGGRYITFPLVITKDPETGVRNVGAYRMQVFDGRTTAMHWQRHKGGAQHYRVAERLGRRLVVAVALGPDPVLAYVATAPVPEGIDELLLAGWLARRRVELVRCVTVDLEVPANAQIVLEGYVEPGERRREGPFGDHTGFYSLPEEFPVFHLQCLTRRREPVYLTTIVGPPPMEDYYLGKASERLFLPIIRKLLPEIVDIHFPAAGIFHNLVIVSIEKRYPGHARKVMHALWGLGQLMFSKVIVVVDRDVNVHDEHEVAWIVGTHIDPARDIEFVRGPLDDLDNAAPLVAYGSKMGVDATRKWPSEGFAREWPRRVVTTEAVGRRAAELWSRLQGTAPASPAGAREPGGATEKRAPLPRGRRES